MKVRFEDVFLDETKRGHKIQASEYLSAGKYPVIDQGQDQIAGYTNLEDGLFKDVPAIIFGDHTRIIKYIDSPFFLGADGVKVLKSKINATDYKYLFYCLQNAKIPNTGYNRHFKWLKDVYIPLPPLDEQRRIAAVLDKVSDLIAKRRAQLDKLDELVKARFVEMFGDPIENNKGLPTIMGLDLFKLSNGKFVPENKRFNKGIPAYGGNGISWYTDEVLCKENSIVVGRVGFQSGNVHFAEGPLWVTDNAMYVSEYNKDKCDLYFLSALMDQIDFTRFQDAGDLKKITQKPFMRMKYIVPDMSCQRKYVRFVKSTGKSKLTIQHSLDKLEILKKALMQEYFG